MKLYYRAVTQNGKQIQGFIEAKDIQEAARYLRKHQLIPVKIIASDQMGIGRYLHFLKKTSTKELIFFTRQLSSMLTWININAGPCNIARSNEKCSDVGSRAKHCLG